MKVSFLGIISLVLTCPCLVIDREAFNTADHYILKLEDMIAAEYPIPTILDSTAVLLDGWHETRPGKEPTPKKLIAVDCEMVSWAFTLYVHSQGHTINLIVFKN